MLSFTLAFEVFDESCGCTLCGFSNGSYTKKDRMPTYKTVDRHLQRNP